MSNTQPLSEKEKPESINARLFDLCRYQRSELFEAELITYEEYMFLMHDCPLAQGSGSPSPRRLENYDEIAEKLKTVTEQRDRLAEAIQKHKDTFKMTPDFCDLELYEALQSLNPNADVEPPRERKANAQ